MATNFNDLGLIENITDAEIIDQTVMTNLAKTKILTYGGLTGTNLYDTARDMETNAAYVVPTGKKFIAVGIRMYTSSGAGGSVALGSSTSGLTTPGGTPPSNLQAARVIRNVVVQSTVDKSICATFPEGIYVSVNFDATGSVFGAIWGYEVTSDATSI